MVLTKKMIQVIMLWIFVGFFYALPNIHWTSNLIVKHALKVFFLLNVLEHFWTEAYSGGGVAIGAATHSQINIRFSETYRNRYDNNGWTPPPFPKSSTPPPILDSPLPTWFLIKPLLLEETFFTEHEICICFFRFWRKNHGLAMTRMAGAIKEENRTKNILFE